MPRRLSARVKERARAAAALNRPQLNVHVVPDSAAPAQRPPCQPVRSDWPPIRGLHPTWWQVERVELCHGQRRYVLIAQCRHEETAFAVADLQLSQVRITRYGDRQRPWLSFRPPREISE